MISILANNSNGLFRRYLVCLSNKMVAFLLDLVFQLIKIDGFGLFYCIFQKRSYVNLLEYAFHLQ